MRYEPKHRFASLSSFGSLVPNSKYGGLSILDPTSRASLGSLLLLWTLEPLARSVWPGLGADRGRRLSGFGRLQSN